MELSISQTLFQQAPFAFAHHSIIRGTDDKPVDIEILDYNDSFQELIFNNVAHAELELASQVKHSFYRHLLRAIHEIDRNLQNGKDFEFSFRFDNNPSSALVQVFSPTKEQFVVVINKSINLSRDETLDYLPVMICKYDKTGRIQYANHEFARLLTLPPSTVVGKTFYELLPEEERERVITILKRLNEGEEVITELRRLDYREKPIWQEWTTSTLKDTNGKIIAYQAVGIDVTEKKEAEIAVIESEARLKAIIDSTPDIICYKDKEGRWLMANDMMIEVFDMEDIDFYGKTDAELASISSPVYKQAFSTCSQSDKMTKNNQGLTRNEELIPYLKEGVLRMYDIVKVPVKEKDGSDKGIVVIGYDITERKAAEDALRASEANFRLLFENSPIGIFAARPNGALIDANQALLDHLSVDTVEQALAINVLTYAPMIKSGFSEAFLRCIRENKMQKGSDFMLINGNQNRSVYIYIFPLTDESNEITRIYGLVEDITDRKQAESALKKARNEAIRASKVKSEFLANMS
ncbi:MAG: PAS domain-containing protein, partial [Bacteroidota bacterium]